MVHSDWLGFGQNFTVRIITKETVRFLFFLFPGKFKLSETRKFLGKRISLQQYNQRKQNLLLLVKCYRSKFATTNIHEAQKCLITQRNGAV